MGLVRALANTFGQGGERVSAVGGVDARSRVAVDQLLCVRGDEDRPGARSVQAIGVFARRNFRIGLTRATI